jgi:hypothetical protein
MTDPLTDAEIEAIKARAEMASGGQWRCVPRAADLDMPTHLRVESRDEQNRRVIQFIGLQPSPSLAPQLVAITEHIAGMDPATTLRLVEEVARLRERVAAIRAAVIDCAYCNGVGAMVRLPGDTVDACPACGGLREALDPEGTTARLAALRAP